MATSSSPTPVATSSTASQRATRMPHQTPEETSHARHIFTVAARSLQDCVELLQTLKEAIVAEQDEEEHGAKKDHDGNVGEARGNGHGNRNDNKTSSNGHGHTNGLTHVAASGSLLSRPGSSCSRTSMQEIHHMSRTGSQDSENGEQPLPPQQQQQHTTKTTVVPEEYKGMVENKAAAQAAAAAGLIVLPTCKKSEIYTKPSVLACKGTIGKHVRHLHDHYRLLFETYPPAQGKSADSEWSVDYDKRSREVPMETDMDFAMQELERLQFLLERYRDPSDDSVRKESNGVPSDLLHPLTLQATIDPVLPPVNFQTTFGRELWFCSLHAVHHFAMIKVICAEFGVSLKDGFGFAPSTIQSQKQQ
ncbi:hypothetical protein EMPS_02597 [Entomortierella parvispora]|uniref:DinB-like domain-containing protein n=1 Tax=Entomortierella parvispora TaxID=205924 RepID=A0A9P3H562_9FUNG|nr:hypothetical protein EMPS_02597 [Entomortierella parvispora]